MTGMTHVLVPRPPWRGVSLPLTGCGRPGGNVTAITVEEYRRMAPRRGGIRPAAPAGICATCAEACSSRYSAAGSTWAEDPVAVIALDIRHQGRTGRRARLAAELRALAALAAAHPGEFAGHLDTELVLTALGGRLQ